MDQLQRLLTQLRTFWSGLGTARKVLLVGVSVLVFAALATYSVLATTGSSSQYVPLFSDNPIPAEEVQAARAKLTAQNIDSQIADDGSLKVPADKKATARVILAADGIPSRGGKGYELFDETSLGSTPFVQNVNYQRAVQTELARSIMQLEPVQNARVLIAKPEATPFIRDQRAPTASVVVKLKPGATLSGATASNIVSLVAHSVDGLKPEHVTVVDSSGRLLSDPHVKDRDNLPAAQIQYRDEVESRLAAKAEEMLTAHLGRGRAVVKVSADINFQKVKERQETFSPEGKVAAAERSTNITSTAPGRAVGVAGARSNLPPVGGGVTQAGGGGTSKEEVLQTDYSLSKTTRDVENDRAAVQKLNVAAIIDLTPPEGATGPTMTVAEVEDIIKKAVGFAAARGDEIKVSNARLGSPTVPPIAEPVEDEAAKFQRLQNYVSLARNISLAVAVVLAVGMLPLILLRRRSRPTPPKVEVPPVPTPEQRRQELLDKLQALAKTDPDRVAEVLTMLAGGK